MVPEDSAIQLRQSVLPIVVDSRIVINCRGRSVSIPASPVWQKATEAVVLGTTKDEFLSGPGGELDEDSPGAAENFISTLHSIDALQAVSRATTIPAPELARHARSLRYFGAYETRESDRFAYLERLRTARVFILGLGGAGSWIAYQLLLAGIGRISAADGDTVAASNLNRTALVHAGDVGRPKAAALQARLSEMFPDAELRFERRMMCSAREIADAAQGSDLIIGAADTPHRLIRLWVSEASILLDTPSIQTGGGRVGPLFVPGHSACAGCLQALLLANAGQSSEAAFAGLDRFALVPASTLSPQPCADSAMLVLEAVRHLAGHQQPVTLNRVLQKGQNLLDGKLIELAPRADCLIGCRARGDA